MFSPDYTADTDFFQISRGITPILQRVLEMTSYADWQKWTSTNSLQEIASSLRAQSIVMTRSTYSTRR